MQILERRNILKSVMRKRDMSKKRYFFWKICDLHEINNGGEVIQDVYYKRYFSNSFWLRSKVNLVLWISEITQTVHFNQITLQLSYL